MINDMHRTQHIFFVILLVAIFGIVFLIFKPFLAPLVMAASLGVVFRPMYARLVKRKVSEGFAALITVLVVVFIVFIPFLVLGQMVFNEAQGLYLNLAAQGSPTGTLQSFADSIESYLHRLAPDVSIDINSFIEKSVSWLLVNLDGFFSGFVRVILALLIMVVALYYMLKDGPKLKKVFTNLSPLSDDDDESISKRVAATINSVIRGSIILALIQSALATLGYVVFGLPNPLLWGLVTLVASFVPGVGTALVVTPAVLYLVFTGNNPGAIGLGIWGAIIVGTADNVISPYLFKRGSNIHPFLILLSVLGGISYFGPIGVILGPVILALLYGILDIYPKIMKS